MATDFASLYRNQLRRMNPLDARTRRMAGALGMELPRLPTPEAEDPGIAPMADPMGLLSQQRMAPTEPPDISPEEESSLLHGAVGGLEWLGQTLDKPGAAVRGLLSGRPEQLANLIPFSDTLGVTDPAQRVSGRQLLEEYGVISPKTEPGIDLGDVAGFGTEILTDPLLFLKAGPLTAKGAAKAAKLAEETANATKTFGEAGKYLSEGLKDTSKLRPYGKTMQSLADQMRAGERSLFGFGLPHIPFTKQTAEHAAAIPIGTGELPAKAVEWLGYKNPVVPGLRGLFSHVAEGTHTGVQQAALDAAYLEKEKLRGALVDVSQAFRNESGGLADTYKQIADHFQKNGDARSFASFSRWAAESPKAIPDGQELLNGMMQHLNLPVGTALPPGMDTQAIVSQYHQFFDTLRTSKDAAMSRYLELGGQAKELEDIYAQHFPRRADEAVRRLLRSGKRGRTTEAEFDFARHRAAALTDLPGNSEQINRMATNPLLAGREVDQATGGVVAIDKADLDARLAAELTARQIPIPANATTLDMQRELAASEIVPMIQQAEADGLFDALAQSRNVTPHDIATEQIADWTKTRKVKVPQGGNKVMEDIIEPRATRFVNYIKGMPDDVVANGLFNRQVVDDWFGYMHSILGDIATMEGLHSFMDQPGVVTAFAGNPLAKGAPGKLLDAWEGAGFNREGLRNWVQTKYPNTPMTMAELDQAVNELAVSEAAANTIKTFGDLTKPSVKQAYEKAFDWFTRKYKYAWTIGMPTPAFNVRNWIGGTFNAHIDSKVSIFQLLKGQAKVDQYIRSLGQKGAKFLQEARDNGVLSSGPLAEVRNAEEANKLAEQLPKGLFGGSLEGFLHPVKHAKNILKGEAGLDFYNYTETILRGGYYEALREAGYTPAAAKHLVMRTQFDYALASPLERNVLKKVVPFYGWLRNNLPYQLEQLALRPGGRAAQAVRAYKAFSAGGEGEGYAPSFLREGLAVPIGGTPQATTFLRQAGLPLEDLNKFVFNRSGLPAAGRTTEKFAAGMHPAIIGPAEWWAGKQFWSGRDIKNLESPTEKLAESFGATNAKPYPMIDTLLHYSPLSTGTSALLTGADPRKDWWQRVMNLTTGLKSATYDTEKWKLIDLQDALKKQADENPLVREMVRPYVPERYRALPEAVQAQTGIKKADQLARAIGALKKRRAAEGTAP